MTKKRLPPDVLAYFRDEGRKGGTLGGALGGKTSTANMTRAARAARATKASAAERRPRSAYASAKLDSTLPSWARVAVKVFSDSVRRRVRRRFR